MTWFRRILAVSFVLIICTPSYGESLPTKGTFKGIYHRDRAGVGHFADFFLVHESLRPKFDKYDGKLIEVEVTKGIQPMNPGSSIILEVGKITELPAAPVSVTVQTIPSRVVANSGIQFLVNVHNTSQKTVKMLPSMITVKPMRVPEMKTKHEYFGSGYDSSQMMGGRRSQLLNSLVYFPWKRHGVLGYSSSYAGRGVLKPGESFSAVLVYSKGLDAGLYETEVKLRHHINNGADSIPVATWLSFDISDESKVAPIVKSGLELEMSNIKTSSRFLARYSNGIKSEHKFYSANLQLTNNGQTERVLSQIENSVGNKFWIGAIEGWTSDGELIPLTFLPPSRPPSRSPDNPWTLAEINPSETVVSEILFEPVSFFPGKPIARITCDLLTDEGLETFVLTDSFDDSLFMKPPPYGPVSNGLKCRIRTESKTYKRGEGIGLLWEIANTKKKAVTFTSGKGWTVEIDGKKIKGPIDNNSMSGWATIYGKYVPKQKYLLIDTSKLSAGEHKFQIYYKGSGGSYKNSYGKKIPIFKGKLKSNIWTFTVEHK